MGAGNVKRSEGVQQKAIGVSPGKVTICVKLRETRKTASVQIMQ